MYFWSPSKSGFFTSDIHIDSMPEDVVEISEELYLSLLAAQCPPNNKVITSGADGVPVETDRPPPTSDQIISANTAQRNWLLAQAGIAISPLQDAIDLNEATDAETASLKAWKQYRVDLNRVDLTQPAPLWPELPSH